MFSNTLVTAERNNLVNFYSILFEKRSLPKCIVEIIFFKLTKKRERDRDFFKIWQYNIITNEYLQLYLRNLPVIQKS